MIGDGGQRGIVDSTSARGFFGGGARCGAHGDPGSRDPAGAVTAKQCCGGDFPDLLRMRPERHPGGVQTFAMIRSR